MSTNNYYPIIPNKDEIVAPQFFFLSYYMKFRKHLGVKKTFGARSHYMKHKTQSIQFVYYRPRKEEMEAQRQRCDF